VTRQDVLGRSASGVSSFARSSSRRGAQRYRDPGRSGAGGARRDGARLPCARPASRGGHARSRLALARRPCAPPPFLSQHLSGGGHQHAKLGGAKVPRTGASPLYPGGQFLVGLRITPLPGTPRDPQPIRTAQQIQIRGLLRGWRPDVGRHLACQRLQELL
jgi:hypothetical protein